jgi:hypothetical protein
MVFKTFGTQLRPNLQIHGVEKGTEAQIEHKENPFNE